MKERVGKQKLIVIAGPSGAGKTTLFNRLLEDRDCASVLTKSVSTTTRPKRPGEVEGVHYYFTTSEQFMADVRMDRFIEWAVFGGNLYGTHKAMLKRAFESGKSVLRIVELEGVRQIKKQYPNGEYIFIMPPSLAELEHRIRGDGRNVTEEEIATRMHRAREEMDAVDEFGFVVYNKDLDLAFSYLRSYILSVIL